MQALYTTTDQRVQGNTKPQQGVRTPCNRLSSQGIRLRPVSDLGMSPPLGQSRVLIPLSADAYRGLFTFGVFNAIQSTCFDDVSLPMYPMLSVF